MFSLKTHNVLDYVGGVVILFLPAIFGFGEIDAARNSFLVSGFGLIAYSLLTRYDYAVWRVIPLSSHMALDVLNGVFIMLAPWIFDYRDILTSGQEVLHYIVALGFFGLVAFTRTQAEMVTGSGTTELPHTAVEPERKAG